MPRLSLPYWLALAVFLFFYGFTVFALTRDYYLRHPSQPVAAQTPTSSGSSRDAMSQLGTSAIPDSITESNPELLRQSANGLFMQQRYAEAAPLYRRILELDPEDAEAHNDLGLALHYIGDTQGAIENLRAAVAKSPGQQRPWLTLGFINLRAGNTAEARDALERARDLDPDSAVGKEATRLLGVLDAE